MHRNDRTRFRLLNSTLAIALASGGVVLPGCGSLSGSSRRAAIERQLENDPNRSIAGIHGPTERQLNANSWKKTREDLATSGDAEVVAALAAYDAAEAQYEAGEFAAAEKAFKKVAESRRKKHETRWTKWNRNWGIQDTSKDTPYSNFGDAIEEDSLFMVAQCQFAQKRYAKAQDSYDELLNRYPSSRHLDQTTRQLFRIARYWLGFPETINDKGDAEVQVASHEQQGSMPERNPSSLDRVPVLPNLTDRTRPIFDTYGRGEQALRSIWLHDATGPLADDALMLAANHNLRTENFVEAARLYTLLREQYPDSSHAKDAFLLGSHVALASYQGAEYDGKSLENSLELKQTLVQAFPDLEPEQRSQLMQEIDRLKSAEVDRLWNVVEFYQAKRNDPAMALHCYLILNKYPDSEQAERARAKLAEIDSRRATAGESRFPWQRSPQQPPIAAAPEEPSPAPQAPGVAEPPAEKPGAMKRFGNMLRRAEEPPQLQRIEEEPDNSGPIENSAPPGIFSL